MTAHKIIENAKVGDTLIYKLRPDQLPLFAEQPHHGIIKVILVDIHDRSQARYYIVQSIECSVHGNIEIEIVYPSQVMGFQPV